ncbi:MAG: phosphate ABC transporter permease family protein, partial [Roseibium sp.]
MSLFWLIVIVLAIALVGYVVGRARALASAGGDMRLLHSLPSYYGSNVAMKAAVPAFLILVVWLLAQPFYVDSRISGMIPQSAISEGSSLGLVMAEVRRAAQGLDNVVASGQMTEDFARNARADFNDITARLKDAGQIVTSQITQPVMRAAQAYRVVVSTGNLIMSIVVILAAIAGALLALRETNVDFRARNTVEKGIRVALFSAALIAVLTTLGIVLSLVFNTVEFFRLYPAMDFFFGLTWSPSFSGRGGSSELGILPLLWGTFYISIVALAVAVPIGL